MSKGKDCINLITNHIGIIIDEDDTHYKIWWYNFTDWSNRDKAVHNAKITKEIGLPYYWNLKGNIKKLKPN